MATMNKPASGDTNWYQPVTDNWTALEKLQYELVEKKTISVATTSVTFSSLNGDSDGIYVLLFTVYQSTGSDGNLRIRVNSDTGTNYHIYSLGGGATALAVLDDGYYSYMMDANLYSGSPISGRIFMHVAPRFNIQYNGTVRAYHEVYVSGHYAGHWGISGYGPASSYVNVTSLDVLSSIANGLGANSVLSLYRVRS
jgi:hypothetical protein